jgi:hypothetical protein
MWSARGGRKRRKCNGLTDQYKPIAARPERCTVNKNATINDFTFRAQEILIWTSC